MFPLFGVNEHVFTSSLALAQDQQYPISQAKSIIERRLLQIGSSVIGTRSQKDLLSWIIRLLLRRSGRSSLPGPVSRWCSDLGPPSVNGPEETHR